MRRFVAGVTRKRVTVKGVIMKNNLGALLLIAALCGCDRTHMSANFGMANRSAFRAQVIHRDAGTQRRAEQPLDPEEAAIVAKTYLRSLAPKDAQEASAAGQRVLLVPPVSSAGGMPLPNASEAYPR
jgi:hypothetical protein